jgi:membrane associated rhomboid family serine protease
MTRVRAAATARQAQEWSLVLAAEGIAHRVQHGSAGWALLVAEADTTRAETALAAYDVEAGGAPQPSGGGGAPTGLAVTSGIAAGALLLAFFAVTGPPAAGTPWFERGAAAAGRIVDGEPWRAVTALTLHVDAVHVAGNALAVAVLLAAVVQQLGVGLGVWLVLLAGAVGNAVAALLRDPRHVAVGASTAAFGAIGVLAALRLVSAGGAGAPRKRWIVGAATLLLLAMLGVGHDVDVLAHALGLVAGLVLGLPTGAALRRPLAPAVQWPMVALAALAVVGAWWLALR